MVSCRTEAVVLVPSVAKVSTFVLEIFAVVSLLDVSLHCTAHIMINTAVISHGV